MPRWIDPVRGGSQQRHAEQRGHGVQPALGVAVAGVADLHVHVLQHEAGSLQLLLHLRPPLQLDEDRGVVIVGPLGTVALMLQGVLERNRISKYKYTRHNLLKC